MQNDRLLQHASRIVALYREFSTVSAVSVEKRLSHGLLQEFAEHFSKGYSAFKTEPDTAAGVGPIDLPQSSEQPLRVKTHTGIARTLTFFGATREHSTGFLPKASRGPAPHLPTGIYVC